MRISSEFYGATVMVNRRASGLHRNIRINTLLKFI